jgi:YVTN family beta-propeller protein
VARVELGAQSQDTVSRLNGQPAVTMGVYLSPGANAVSVAAAMRKTLDELATRYPEGLRAQVLYDSTTFVVDTIREVITTLLEAFVLVVLVVYLFLGSLRATLIPTIAVPVSLIGTFAVLLVVGYSANTISRKYNVLTTASGSSSSSSWTRAPFPTMTLSTSTNAVTATVTVGTSPSGIAYDGANVWVTNYGSLSVSKVNASTNTVSTTLTVGKQPYQALYSAGSIWVTNFASATVSRIRPA